MSVSVSCYTIQREKLLLYIALPLRCPFRLLHMNPPPIWRGRRAYIAQYEGRPFHIGWRELNPIWFRSTPFTARLCVCSRQATALPLPHTLPHEKFAGRNSHATHKEQNFCSDEAGERGNTAVFQVTRQNQTEILPSWA